MLTKTIEYVDFLGNKRKEDLYFNLSEAEVVEMELSTTGGLSEMAKRIVKAKDTPSMVQIFKDLILKSYGEISPDGKRFVKSKELSEAFSQTPAYSQLFMELVSDTDKAIDFFNGITPGDKDTEEIKKIALEQLD
ncbi:MAG TPA: hypothetical protein DCW90_12960 [Lachnospiraceae bacterium]|nr:hypothetical protein [Lachnospiraceae bacterium]